MTEILNCRCCKRPAVFSPDGKFWYCPNEVCGVCGPYADKDGAKWNWLMAPHETVKAEAAEGTVRARIPIVVDTEGNWAATAWSEQDSDSEKVSHLIGWDVTKEPSVVHWITADIPLPQSAEIKGVVNDE